MSNQRLRRGILEYLKKRQLPSVLSVDVETEDGVATLRGVVTSPYARWACRECCRHVTGVIRVIDELQIEGEHPA